MKTWSKTVRLNHDTDMIRFSTRHPISVMMAVLAVVLMGGIGAFAIRLDLFPAISTRAIAVAASYPGLAPSEVRTMLAMPLEDALAALKGLERVTSVSREGLAIVTAHLRWGTDADMALVEAREIVDAAYTALPSAAEKPAVIELNAAHSNAVSIAMLVRNGGSLASARYTADKDLKMRFQRLKGVAAVTITGGEKERIEVAVRRDAAEGRGLDLAKIAEALNAQNFEYPAGTIREGDKDLLVKTTGLFRSLDDIASSPLRSGDAGTVAVRDIAAVHRGFAPRATFFTIDGAGVRDEGEPENETGVSCIQIAITKKNGESPLALSAEVRRELERILLLYGTAYDFRIVKDQATEFRESLINVGVSAIVGVLVTFGVILLCFRSLSLSLIIVSVIPLSALVEVFVLYVCGRSLNTMSLSGIALGIGMVIDSAAVVLENLEKTVPPCGRDSGVSICAAVEKAVKEVKNSNIASTVTTDIVFLPVFLMGGWVQELFADMALGIVTAVSAACVLSFTVIPALFVLVAPGNSAKAKKAVQAKKERTPERAVLRFLKYVCRRRYVAAVLLLVSTVLGFLSLRAVKKELLPEIEPKAIACELVFPAGTSLERMEEVASEALRRIRGQAWFLKATASGGLEADDYPALADPGGKTEKVLIQVSLVPRFPARSAAAALASLLDLAGTERPQNAAAPYTYRSVDNQGSLSALFRRLFPAARLLTADTPEDLYRIAERFKIETAFVPAETAREYVFTPDRTVHARFQIPTVFAATLARQALTGVFASPFYEAGREFPLWVGYPKGTIRTVSDIEALPVMLPQHDADKSVSMVPLRSLGRISEENNEKVLYRYARKDAKILTWVPQSFLQNPELKGHTIDTFSAEMISMLRTAFVLLGGVLLLLYLAIGAQFESFALPLVFLLSIIPAFSGAFASLVLTGKSLNMNSVIALVILFGIAVNNGIILYESCTEGFRDGDRTNISAKVIYCCEAKLRAILVTTGTTVCAMMPFAIDPFNRSAQSSLAVVLTGGLVVSTAVILVVMPVILITHFERKYFGMETP